MNVKEIVELRLYEDPKEDTFKTSGFGRHKNLFRSAPNPKLCLSIVGPKDLVGRHKKFHLQFEDERAKMHFYDYLSALKACEENN